MLKITIDDILNYLSDSGISFSFSGDGKTALEGFSSLNNYKPGTFTWIKRQELVPGNFDVQVATLVFTSYEVQGNFKNVIRTEASKRAFFSTIEHFFDDNKERPLVGEHTYLGPNVKLGENVHIGHNCTIDGDITIGNDTTIGNNVSIVNRVCIGERCDIHSGVIIGHDGFSYTENDKHEKKMNRHYGGIIIGNDVYIAMNSVVERGIIDDTIIKNGTKIDCLCLIGHNSVIGENAALVGGTRIYGSVIIGDNAYLAGPLVRNQCQIGRNSFIGLGAVVTNSIDDDDLVAGVPAKPIRKGGQS